MLTLNLVYLFITALVKSNFVPHETEQMLNTVLTL
jgi:hypothetical protein